MNFPGRLSLADRDSNGELEFEQVPDQPPGLLLQRLRDARGLGHPRKGSGPAPSGQRLRAHQSNL